MTRSSNGGIFILFTESHEILLNQPPPHEMGMYKIWMNVRIK